MSSAVTAQLERLCETAASFYQRGLAFGSTGNLSLRIGDQVWVSPTGRSLKDLRPGEIAALDLRDGRPLNANKASKESPFHLECYRAAGERATAIVHLHATYSVALSCLDELDENNPLPVFTPYYLMRVLPMAVVPYLRPGSAELAAAMGRAAATSDSILMRNHGATALGASLEEATDRMEELEETAKLYFVLRGEKIRLLNDDQKEEIARAFKSKPR
jgi:ribulose-5-phosphate 4-epimerase/fuculose-1-phosphate aldolase